MKRIISKQIYIACLVFITLVMFVLPFFSYDGYSIISNTTSQLGAQSSPNAWIMNTAFMTIGAGILILFWKVMNNHTVLKTFVMTFGFALILVGLFKHEPGISGVAYNTVEADIHSIIATLMGAAITIFSLGMVWISNNSTGKIWAISAATSSVGFSLLMNTIPDYQGLFQRAMFLIVFIWLYYVADQ